MISSGGPTWSDGAGAEERHAVGAEKRLVGVVRGQNDADAARGQGPRLCQHPDLIPEVEARGRLVHH